MSDTIKVMIVDDHFLMRSGLASVLHAQKDLELIAQANSGTDALAQILERDEICPDVVLMDLKLPGELDGVETTRYLRQMRSHIKILAISSFDDPAWLRAAYQAGVCGYLLKDISGEKLAECIRLAHRGKMIIQPEQAKILFQSDRTTSALDSLTAREEEVLSLLIEGKTNHGIAGDLGITRNTVKSHVSRVLAKLGASSRVEAVRIAIEQGIVEVGSRHA